jgi:predicted HicB family RNase H-like nuclease
MVLEAKSHYDKIKMSTNTQKQKKVSKHVRLEKKLHLRLKIKAAETGKTISRLLGEICTDFLNKSP